MKGVLQVGNGGGVRVSEKILGGNFLFHKDSLDPASGYLDVLDQLNVDHLRYPGGSITELAFDVRNWDATTSEYGQETWENLVPLSEYLAFVSENAIATSIVLPTRNLLVGKIDPASNAPRQLDYGQIDATLDFVRMVLSTDDGRVEKANITALEIGNEYWGSGEMTSAEYGKLVNYLAPRLDDLLNELETEELISPEFERPKIITQMAATWSEEFRPGGYREFSPGGDQWRWVEKLKAAHDDMAGQISVEAMQAIDGLIEHYYYNKDMTAGYTFSGTSSEKSYINTVLDFWKSETGIKSDVEVHITEWNVRASNGPSQGLVGVSTVLQQFEYMLRMGVDAAQLWALEHNTSTNLYGNQRRDELTVQGEGFKMMTEVLPGAMLLEDNYFGQEFEISVYQNGENTHLFVSLRSDQAQSLELNIAEILGPNKTVSGKLLGVDMGSVDGRHWYSGGWKDASYFNENDARPLYKNLSEDELLDGETLSLSFRPFEVLRLDITDRTATVSVEGYDNGSSQFDPRLLNETVEGAIGNDVISAGEGSDTVSGHWGEDTLSGGSGSDTLIGGTGADVLDGGTGDDRVFGESGADRIVGGAGSDLLSGGSGADTFVFESGHGIDTISDFQIGLDILEIDGDIFDTVKSSSDVVGEYLTVGADEAVLDFGNGQSVVLDGLDNVYGLEDSIVIV